MDTQNKEQDQRFKNLVLMNQDIDWFISESITQKQLGSFGMLLFIRGLKIIEATYGRKQIHEILKQVIDEQLSSSASAPLGWNSDDSQWDFKAFLSGGSPSKTG